MNGIAVGFLVGVLLLGLGCVAWRRRRAGDRIAYWHQTIVGLEEDPNRFYAQVHQVLKARLEAPEMALVGFGFGPLREFETTSIFGPRPLYLGVRYKHLTFYVYAGQTPAGFFVSTWLYHQWLRGDEREERPGQQAKARRYDSRETMFQYDTVLMFIESVQTIVLEVLDRYIQEQGLKPLEAYERRPILHAFYRNALTAYHQPITTPHQPITAPHQSSDLPSGGLPYSPPQPAPFHPATPDHAVVAAGGNGEFHSTPNHYSGDFQSTDGSSAAGGVTPRP